MFDNITFITAFVTDSVMSIKEFDRLCVDLYKQNGLLPMPFYNRMKYKEVYVYPGIGFPHKLYKA